MNNQDSTFSSMMHTCCCNGTQILKNEDRGIPRVHGTQDVVLMMVMQVNFIMVVLVLSLQPVTNYNYIAMFLIMDYLLMGAVY